MDIHNFKDYLLERKFNINITSKYIEVLNYINIDHFDNTLIKIKYKDGNVNIRGKNLIIKKLMNDYIIIKGDIKNIEW